MTRRWNPVEPPYDPRVAEDFAALMPAGVDPLVLFRTLALNPRVLRRLRRGGLLDPGSIPLRLRELAILRATARCRAEYEWGVHVAFFGAAAGFGPAELDATVHLGPGAGCWSAEEALVVRLVDELHDLGTVTDATGAALDERFGPDQQVELVVLAGLYRAISQVVAAGRIDLEPGAPRFPSRPERAPAEKHAGSCLCGGVRYEVDGPIGAFGYCHCRSCRKASGSAHAANAPVDRRAFRLITAETLREYESSPGKFRAFCSGCGSPIYARLAGAPEVVRIRLGSLDTPLGDPPRAHTWVEHQADWAPILDPVPQFARWADPTVLDQPGTRRPVG